VRGREEYDKARPMAWLGGARGGGEVGWALSQSIPRLGVWVQYGVATVVRLPRLCWQSQECRMCVSWVLCWVRCGVQVVVWAAGEAEAEAEDGGGVGGRVCVSGCGFNRAAFFTPVPKRLGLAGAERQHLCYTDMGFCSRGGTMCM